MVSGSPKDIDFTQALVRGWWLIALSVILFSGTAYYLSARSTSVYKASTTIRLNPNARSGIGAISTPFSVFSNATLLDDELEVLRSRSLTEAVFERARIEGETLKLLENIQHEKHVRVLQASLTVTPVRKSQLIQITVKAPEAREAYYLANLYADLYRERNQQEARSEISETKEFLREQLGLVKSRLEITEEALKKFQTTTRVVDLAEGTQSTVAKYEEFKAEYNRVQADLFAAEELLKYQRNRLTTRQAEFVAEVQTVTPALLEALREDLGQLETIQSRLLTEGLSPSHEKVAEIEGRASSIRQFLKKAATTILSSTFLLADPVAESQAIAEEIAKLEFEELRLRSKSEALEQIVGGYDQKLEDLPSVALQLSRLDRTRKIDEKIFSMLMEKLEEARIREAGVLGQATIVDRAVVPLTPIAPRPLRDTGIGLLAGLLVGFSAAFLRRRFNNRVEDLEEIQELFGRAPLGTVPHLRSLDKGDEEPCLVVTRDGYQPASEAYRRIAMNLSFAKVDGTLKTMCVTSAVAAEGKSLTAANLSLLLRLNEKSVLLIDADFHRPTLHKLFKTTHQNGLSDVLTSRIKPDQAILKTDFRGLELLPCGSLPPNPGELLSSQAMSKLINELADRYDFVVFDTPPFLPLSDALAVSRKTDGAILVSRMGYSRRNTLREAMQVAEQSQLQILGVVANDYRRPGLRGYPSSYGYDYGYEYGSNGTNENGARDPEKPEAVHIA